MTETQVVEYKRSWRDEAHTIFRTTIEAWGCGSERIMDAYRAAGTPEPEVTVDATGLWTVFRYLPEHQMAASQGNRESRLGEAPVETPVETPRRTPEQILRVLAADPNLTLAEVSQAIGRSLRAVERAAAKLVEQGRLRFVGPRKGGGWEIVGGDDE